MKKDKLVEAPKPRPPVFFRRGHRKPVLVRALTGVGLLLVITGLVMAGPYGFLLLTLSINGLGLGEFYRLFSIRAVKPLQWAAQILAAMLLIINFMILKGDLSPTLVLAGIPLVFSMFLYRVYQPSAHPFRDLAFTFLGILCITVPLAFFVGVGFILPTRGIYHPFLILGYFCLLWANDTGAFLIGKLVGRHPLFKRVSPHKTWEGSIGGALCTIAVALLTWQMVGLNLLHWFTLSGLVMVTGTYGDLIKSLMKRSLGVKDAGTILPGHGGILDRFDSLLGSSPWVFSYLVVLHNA